MGTMYITVGDVTLETATVRKALSPRQREALAYTLQGYKQRERLLSTWAARRGA